MTDDGPKKLPAIQFYTADYQKDTRHLSLEARGAWVDVLCAASHASPRGYATFSGMEQFARMLGCTPRTAKRIRDELLDPNNPTGNAVCDIEEMTGGGFKFISRRMLRDQRRREEDTESGRLGGNPDLGVNYNIPGFIYLMQRGNGECKIGISASPEKRLYRVKKQIDDPTIRLVAKRWVLDMGATESNLHTRYIANRISGEWFKFTGDELAAVLHLNFHLQGEDKVNQPPSSSSSSSSSVSPSPTAGAVNGVGKKSMAQKRAEIIAAQGD